MNLRMSSKLYGILILLVLVGATISVIGLWQLGSMNQRISNPDYSSRF